MSNLRCWSGAALGAAALLLVDLGAARANGPPNHSTYNEYANAVTGRDPVLRLGMDTWFFWTAGDQAFWGRAFPIATKGQIDLLRLLDARVLPRAARFSVLGVINDPDTRAPSGPDPYGFQMDEPRDNRPPNPLQLQLYGAPTGIIGLRKFPNPNFNANQWNAAGGAAGYLSKTPQTFDPSLEPPYLIGVSCAVCHVAFHPLHPPRDVTEPNWEDLAPAIGNQYFKEGAVFSGGASPDQFRVQAALTQEPGTSDTSRITDDFINNPTAITPVFGLAPRLRIRTYEEVSPAQAAFIKHMPRPIAADLKPGPPPRMLTAHGLMDGADSVGLALASLRVYANIGGLDTSGFLQSLPTAANNYTQSPFDIVAAKANPNHAWVLTEQFATPMKDFLASLGPMPLERAPGGRRYLHDRPQIVRQGAIVFADNCASCHSSKQPRPDITNPARRREAFRKLVLSEDFLVGNSLSDDRRYPLTDIGTNAARTFGDNATAGHIWDSFSSETYKELPGIAPISGRFNPLDPSQSITLHPPDGGPGYYRTSSLISLWATGPYLHNNTLGTYNGDPSVDGRMQVFQDGITKLLWPALRAGTASVKRTAAASILTDDLGNPIPVPGPLGPLFNVPASTPVNLLASLHPADVPAVVGAYATGGPPAALQKALERNRCPDFAEDGGHLFGTQLSDSDKQALIAYLKRL